MSATAEKPSMPSVVDWPLGIGLALTGVFYALMYQPMFQGTLIHRYTTEHTVEYVVVTFFLWGLVDVVFHIVSFPGEFLALRYDWCSRRTGREPASRAALMLARLRQLPPRLLKSRIGKRYVRALNFVDEKGSADGLSEQIRHLADYDYEQTQANYALLRFIALVMPMFGFMGTVVHFGTALAGQTAGSISENLPHVVSAMGTAFNTTTAALVGATTMMFAVFICERIERGIILTIDGRVDQDLLNRFEVADANMGPFLEALESSNRATLVALDAAVARHLEISTQALGQALDRLEQRFDEHDQRRDERFARLVTAFEEQSRNQLAAIRPAAEQIGTYHGDMTHLVESLGAVVGQHGELVALQTSLADNLRLLRETRQIDQAVHGLTAAIHLLTARGHDARAA